jgi:purine-cytosine permease-like protein
VVRGVVLNPVKLILIASFFFLNVFVETYRTSERSISHPHGYAVPAALILFLMTGSRYLSP